MITALVFATIAVTAALALAVRAEQRADQARFAALLKAGEGFGLIKGARG